MVSVGITGLGSCLPETVVTNFDLEKIVDTTDKWITKHTGIITRRVSRPEESLPILMSIAALRALRDANLSPLEVDYIWAGTNNTDSMLQPSIAARTQYLIGSHAAQIPAADINAGCSGTSYATEVGLRFLRDISVTENRKATCLVLGGDTLWNAIESGDRSNLCILSDAAGAAVYQVIDDESLGLKHVINRADGFNGTKINYSSPFRCRIEGTDPLRLSQGKFDPQYFKMAGSEVHEFVVEKMPELLSELFKKAGLPISDLAKTTLVPHQMNLISIKRGIRQVRKLLGYEPKFTYTDGIVKYGNNSTASTLIGLDECHRQGIFEKGGLYMTLAFGAGLTWGASIGFWNRDKPQTLVEYDPAEQRRMVASLNEKYDDWKKNLAGRETLQIENGPEGI